MTQEALKLALEFLEDNQHLIEEHERPEYLAMYDKAISAVRKALAQPEQEPVAHSVIAGVLFDFMGWLTSRKERIVLSSADNASPAVEAITEFAKMRNLSLDDAKVQDWHTHPPQPEQEPVKFHEAVISAWSLREVYFDENGEPSIHRSPPQRTWVGLTDEEIKEIVGPYGDTPIKGYTRKLFDQIEAKLKEKNNG